MPSLQSFFFPCSVAVIGASTDPERIGGRPLRFMVEGGFKGALYPVNVNGAAEIQGRRAYRSLLEIPGDVEHAIIAVPAAGVEQALRECAEKGVKAVQVFAAGFAEVGSAGAALQARLVDIARAAGMRLVGPNALGLLNPATGLFATFSTALNGLRPRAGSIGLATQSGAFGSAAYGMATLRGMGLSRVIATGNEADVDVAECIEYLAQDDDTRVICAAIESCRDGNRLRTALLKAADAGKPVVIMKIGHTEVGAAAAATHTGSLAGNDAVYDTVFAECGALRTHSIEEMLDVAYVCGTAKRLPANADVGIVTGSGGVGILMADNATELGLALPPFPAKTAAALGEILPFAAVANPYDTTAQVTSVPDGMTRVMSAIVEGSQCAAIFAYLAHVGLSPQRFAGMEASFRALAAEHPDRLFVLVMLSDAGVTQRLEAAGVCVFEDPTRAVRAVAGAARLHLLRQHLHRLPSDVRAAADPLPPIRNESDAKALLAAAGIPVPPERLCASVEDAFAAAESMGFPVVAKIVSPDIAHKTEIGGVILDIRDPAALATAYGTVLARASAAAPQARIDGVLVTPMLRGGIETIVGIHMDPVFGPMAMFGLGGTAVELFKDVAFASAPLTPERAQSMVRSVRSSRLLSGWRGGPVYDEAALVDALCALSALAVEHADELQGIDINPFVVWPQGAVCLDALISMRSGT